MVTVGSPQHNVNTHNNNNNKKMGSQRNSHNSVRRWRVAGQGNVNRHQQQEQGLTTTGEYNNGVTGIGSGRWVGAVAGRRIKGTQLNNVAIINNLSAQ